MRSKLVVLLFLAVVQVFAQEKNHNQNIDLGTLSITARQNNQARKLVKEVIKNQKKNSPKYLGNYEFKEYSKIYFDSPNAMSLPAAMGSPKDSLQLEEWMKQENSFDFLIEKGTRYYYDKKYGEKIKTEAYRISGIQTPLVELAAIDPLPYELNEDKFNFFYFKQFINPMSNYGMSFYNYQIRDTVRQDSLKLIRLDFKSLKSVTPPLYGTVLIDVNSKAIANFYAEYESKDVMQKGIAAIQIGDSERNSYEIESKYKPYKGVWIPVSQKYNAFFYPKDKSKSPSFVKAQKTFKDFKTNVNFKAKDFRGYKNDLPKSAFKNFKENIIPYRNKPLTNIEQNTYKYVDEEGKKAKIDLIIKEGRLLVNGLNLPLGKIDAMLYELIGGNEYEGYRLGMGIRTNSSFSEHWGLKGRVNYGFDDKKIKYALGAHYNLVPQNNGVLSIEYMNDVNPSGRVEDALRDGFNYFRSSLVNANKYELYQQKKWTLSYMQDAWNNLTLQFGVSKSTEKALFIKTLANTDFKNTAFRLNLRWSPFYEYIKTPYGKFNIKEKSPSFYLTVINSNKLLNGDFNFTRFSFTAEHQLYILPTRDTFLKLNLGTTLGIPPLWYTFNEGAKYNNNSIFDLLSIGGTDTFETMPPDFFYSTSFASFTLRQKLFSLGKKDGGSTYFVFKSMYGYLNKDKVLYNYNKVSPNKYYNEVGLEFRKLILNSLGVGVYYRVGAYNTHNFKEDFSIKATIDLPFLEIKF